jgi:site-specific recombinase XerD
MKVSEELSISFWLRKFEGQMANKKTIMVKIIIRGMPSDGFSLGYQVDPAKFDRKAGVVIGKSAEVAEINNHILHVRSELLRYYNLLKAEDPAVMPMMIKNAYKKIGVKHEQKTLLQVFDYHYEKFSSKVTEGKRSAATLKKWKTTKDKVKQFLKDEYKLTDIPLTKIEDTFGEDFQDFLTSTNINTGRKAIDDNTASKYIKNTKHVLKLAVKRKWLKQNPLADHVCSYVNPERDLLNIDEISVLYYKQFSIPRLQEIKDVYLFMCMTGYAYQDVRSLVPGNVEKFFDGEDWIIKNREKTWCRENVPLLPIAKEIIAKYKDHPVCVSEGRLLPVKSNQRFNAYLKEIMEICGINKNLTTHTARHTFATTVTLANGVPIETVSAMLGHGSLKTTQIYAKIVASKVGADMKALKEKFILPASLLSHAA